MDKAHKVIGDCTITVGTTYTGDMAFTVSYGINIQDGALLAYNESATQYQGMLSWLTNTWSATHSGTLMAYFDITIPPSFSYVMVASNCQGGDENAFNATTSVISSSGKLWYRRQSELGGSSGSLLGSATRGVNIVKVTPGKTYHISCVLGDQYGSRKYGINFLVGKRVDEYAASGKINIVNDFDPTTITGTVMLPENYSGSVAKVPTGSQNVTVTKGGTNTWPCGTIFTCGDGESVKSSTATYNYMYAGLTGLHVAVNGATNDDSSGSGQDHTCFVAGTKVICVNDDGAYYNEQIENIVEGQKVLGANGVVNTVALRDEAIVGKRPRVMTLRYKDICLNFTDDHKFWVRQNGREFWGLFNKEMQLAQMQTSENGKSLNQIQYESQCIARGVDPEFALLPLNDRNADCIAIDNTIPIEFATIDGWVTLNAEHCYDYKPTDKVYHLVCHGNGTYYAECFLVGGRPFATDIDWDNYVNV